MESLAVQEARSDLRGVVSGGRWFNYSTARTAMMAAISTIQESAESVAIATIDRRYSRRCRQLSPRVVRKK